MGEETPCSTPCSSTAVNYVKSAISHNGLGSFLEEVLKVLAISLSLFLLFIGKMFSRQLMQLV